MGKISQSIERIKSLLKNDTTDVLLSEYLDLLNQHTELLEKQLEDFETENQTLREENARLLSELSDKVGINRDNWGQDDFVETHGAYFLKKSDGKFSETPYCTICKSPMSDVFGSTYHCSPCSHTWGYTRSDAGKIVKELEKKSS